MNTRDSLGMAIKATHAVIDGKTVMLQKDPQGADFKKSLKGKVFVTTNEENEIIAVDGFEELPETLDGKENLLQTVFENGELLIETTLSEIRDEVNKLV